MQALAGGGPQLKELVRYPLKSGVGERLEDAEVERRGLAGDLVSFADGYPLLLAHQKSLDQLNSQLAPNVPMACFRPNLVVAGFEPFAELTWSRLRIGRLEFEVGGPCVRCQLTTRDPKTGKRRRDGEPLAALAKHHRSEGGVVFGINLIPRTVGRLSVGDPVEILATC